MKVTRVRGVYLVVGLASIDIRRGADTFRYAPSMHRVDDIGEQT